MTSIRSEKASSSSMSLVILSSSNGRSDPWSSDFSISRATFSGSDSRPTNDVKIRRHSQVHQSCRPSPNVPLTRNIRSSGPRQPFGLPVKVSSEQRDRACKHADLRKTVGQSERSAQTLNPKPHSHFSDNGRSQCSGSQSSILRLLNERRAARKEAEARWRTLRGQLALLESRRTQLLKEGREFQRQRRLAEQRQTFADERVALRRQRWEAQISGQLMNQRRAAITRRAATLCLDASRQRTFLQKTNAAEQARQEAQMGRVISDGLKEADSIQRRRIRDEVNLKKKVGRQKIRERQLALRESVQEDIARRVVEEENRLMGVENEIEEILIYQREVEFDIEDIRDLLCSAMSQ